MMRMDDLFSLSVNCHDMEHIDEWPLKPSKFNNIMYSFTYFYSQAQWSSLTSPLSITECYGHITEYSVVSTVSHLLL